MVVVLLLFAMTPFSVPVIALVLCKAVNKVVLATCCSVASEIYCQKPVGAKPPALEKEEVGRTWQE